MYATTPVFDSHCYMKEAHPLLLIYISVSQTDGKTNSDLGLYLLCGATAVQDYNADTVTILDLGWRKPIPDDYGTTLFSWTMHRASSGLSCVGTESSPAALSQPHQKPVLPAQTMHLSQPTGWAQGHLTTLRKWYDVSLGCLLSIFCTQGRHPGTHAT